MSTLSAEAMQSITFFSRSSKSPVGASLPVRRRSFWWGQLIALVLTLAFAGLATLALALIFAGSQIASLLASRLSFGSAFVTGWALLQWPVALFFLLVAFELLYNFAPAGWAERRLHWTSPGAVVGITLWLTASFGFRAYLDRIDLYALTYGSLGCPFAA